MRISGGVQAIAGQAKLMVNQGVPGKVNSKEDPDETDIPFQRGSVDGDRDRCFPCAGAG